VWLEDILHFSRFHFRKSYTIDTLCCMEEWKERSSATMRRHRDECVGKKKALVTRRPWWPTGRMGENDGLARERDKTVPRHRRMILNYCLFWDYRVCFARTRIEASLIWRDNRHSRDENRTSRRSSEWRLNSDACRPRSVKVDTRRTLRRLEIFSID